MNLQQIPFDMPEARAIAELYVALERVESALGYRYSPNPDWRDRYIGRAEYQARELRRELSTFLSCASVLLDCPQAKAAADWIDSAELGDTLELPAAPAASRPTVHRFATGSDAYAASQTSDAIRDGDVLVVESENAVAIMVKAWPTAIDAEHKGTAFHELELGGNWSRIPAIVNADSLADCVDYSSSEQVALEQVAALESDRRALHELELELFARAELAGSPEPDA